MSNLFPSVSTFFGGVNPESRRSATIGGGLRTTHIELSMPPIASGLSGCMRLYGHNHVASEHPQPEQTQPQYSLELTGRPWAKEGPVDRTQRKESRQSFGMPDLKRVPTFVVDR